MTIKINAFQFINGQDENRISYTYSVLDDDGMIVKANIRKSTVLKVSDTNETDAVTSLLRFLELKEQII
jgi:hypothetical protein